MIFEIFILVFSIILIEKCFEDKPFLIVKPVKILNVTTTLNNILGNYGRIKQITTRGRVGSTQSLVLWKVKRRSRLLLNTEDVRKRC